MQASRWLESPESGIISQEASVLFECLITLEGRQSHGIAIDGIQTYDPKSAGA